MEKEVWNAAVKDTVGLKKFFKSNTSNYAWSNRVDAVILSSASKESIEKVRDELQKDVSVENILATINKDDNLKVISTANTFEEGNQALPQDFEFKKGVSKIYNYNDSFHVFNVKQIMPKANKPFDEAKGTIINDFQNEIEKNWVLTLKEQFKVEMNEEVFAKVKSQIIK